MADDEEKYPILITAKEASEILGVSSPTFKKIQKQHQIRSVKVGARHRFFKADVLKVFKKATPAEASKRVPLNVMFESSVKKLEVSPDIFDLRIIHADSFDPYGVLSILCELVQRAKAGIKTELLVNDSEVCAYLKAVGFFEELEGKYGDYFVWDKEVLKQFSYDRGSILIPLKAIRFKGEDRIVAASLVELLKKQGYKEEVRNYVGSIIGELADNSMTHSATVLGDRLCYLLVEKFILEKKFSCIVVGIADVGVGIHRSLKTNPKYQGLEDRVAFLEAFRPHVSSWDDAAKRGKGLADMLGVAMGNHGYLKVDSGANSFFMDFRNEGEESIKWKRPLTKVDGTRFCLVLIDKHFEPIKRKNVDQVISRRSKLDGN